MNRHRLDAIEKNVEWLRDIDVNDETDRIEAAKRLGLIKGDVQALIRELSK